MPAFVTVTGATGNIGKDLVERLLEGGRRVRAVARHADRLAPLVKRGAEAFAGDVANTSFLAEAFQGAEVVFAMVPPDYAADDMRAYQWRIAASLTQAMKRARVPRVVALSSIGAGLPSETGPIAGLHEFEERLAEVPGLSSVVLRPAFFMENHLASIPLIRAKGINAGAVQADLPLQMIATRDIASTAAELLAAPTFEGREVRDLLGPRDHSMMEATSILGAAIGKPSLPYIELSSEDAHQALLGAGFSESAADSMVEMYRAFNEGRVQETVRRSASNSTPTTLEKFAREVFAPAYRKG